MYSPLSPRHAELAELIAAGHTNAEIAARFNVHTRVIGDEAPSGLPIGGIVDSSSVALYAAWTSA